MINRYYRQEIGYLRDLAADFSKAHPALAPMLSGPSADPDVERLLEGVAFLTALLRQKLDDEFPEIIHELMQLIWPHYLRPIPSTTIVAFDPKPTLKQPTILPAGISVASIPVEGTSCLFKTCYDVELHPLSLIDAVQVQPAAQPPSIQLTLQLNGVKLSDWQPNGLRLFLAGDYPSAADLYLLLRNHLKRIVINPLEGGASAILTPEYLKPAGFAREEGVFPYPSHSFPGYRILQEYFIIPEKFLFFDLVGWEQWKGRGSGGKFEVRFELDGQAMPTARIRKESFVLFATPAVNIFAHDAEPIRIDHRQTEYLVRPSGVNSGHRQVYSIERVVSFIQGTAEEKTYVPFEFFNPRTEENPVYHSSIKRSLLDLGLDFHLSVGYLPDSGLPVSETLSIDLNCTNGALPESLHPGDIRLPTSSTPEFAEFRNITAPTPYFLPALGTNLLWRLLSHLALNYFSLANAENLRAILQLYIFSESRDRLRVQANKRRVAGVEHVDARGSNRLVSGIMMRGQSIKLRLRQDHFASPGDLYLFGCALDHFLGCYASINNYTDLVVEEVLKGETYRWPPRIGDRPLI